METEESPSVSPTTSSSPDEDVELSASTKDSGSEQSGISVGRESLEEQLNLEEHFENGRRYANQTYIYPNDEEEETRLTIIHQVHLLLLKGELTVSRITDRVKRILDVGTGPGNWAIAMGEKYPEATVIGVDITAYRPTNVPPNVTFQIDDASREWTWTEPFDLIHMRDLGGSFKDWQPIYVEARKNLTPDGTLELSEGGPFALGVNEENSYVHIFKEACKSAMEQSDYAWWYAHVNKNQIEKSGLRVIKSITMEVPLGEWSKDPKKRSLGKMALVATLESIEATGLRLLTQQLGWTVEHVKELSEKVKAELLDPKLKPFLPVNFVVARKLELEGLD